ncbi:PH domain-containing protein [Microbacterium sp. CJ88]|uniref:PH domain-containing protein n=1 Tax=Microbacterium sp. CJ88 TaxID=3445672 RepID=UPI003F656C7A
MTTSPEAPTPDSTTGTDRDVADPVAHAIQATDAAAARAGESTAPLADELDGQRDVAGPDPVLDRGTYDRIREPRGGTGIPVGDGTWHQISRSYVWVQLISNGLLLLLVVAVALVLALVLRQWWAYIPGGVLAVMLVWTIAITPRQARSIGYQLRRDDLVFRRGILWQRTVAVPYGRMQLVDITHGPLDRGFGIAQLKLVTAAAATGVTIPGLTQDAAERLRDTLVEVAETRRTGL